MLVASHESGGDRVGSECKDKTSAQSLQAPWRGERLVQHRGGAASEKVRPAEGSIPEASPNWDFQNVDTVALGDQRELRSRDSLWD